MDFYLGIDIGTSRVKAVLFDQHFTACASAAENTSPRLSAQWLRGTGYDPAVAFGALAILRQIARHPALQAQGGCGLSASPGKGGVWLSDEQGEPVGPGDPCGAIPAATSWLSDLLRRPGFDRRYFRRYRHPPAALQYQPAAVRWLKQYQPWRGWRPRAICFSPRTGSAFALTGVAALELTDASSSLLNQQTGSWSSVVMNEMGLNELLPLFPPLLAPDAPAGTLRATRWRR
ncbi:hypothetical protein LN650_23435 [Klebsiella pneumoniae subsp. pneumoniae]|nr:hypothetical protein [Klebsiella pneumoniae subsp. pneumoniae]